MSNYIYMYIYIYVLIYRWYRPCRIVYIVEGGLIVSLITYGKRSTALSPLRFVARGMCFVRGFVRSVFRGVFQGVFRRLFRKVFRGVLQQEDIIRGCVQYEMHYAHFFCIRNPKTFNPTKICIRKTKKHIQNNPNYTRYRPT